MKKYVIGDIHGAYKALVQVLERSFFDYEEDELIVLGDICDGWPETCECFEELLKIKKLKILLGNHDQWLQRFIIYGKNFEQLDNWCQHGGYATILSYKGKEDLLIKHGEFLNTADLAYVDDNDNAFVHAGVTSKDNYLDKQSDYLWTRYFYDNAITWHKQNYKFSVKLSENSDRYVKEWFIGHTPTTSFKKDYRSNKPIKLANITFMDTGAAFNGVLSMLNLETSQLYQSDRVCELYPNDKGRNDKSFNQQKILRDNTSQW
jgi:serine/threonine protein phosphatase 1